eukprot:72576-Rhodomonas_salina.1
MGSGSSVTVPRVPGYRVPGVPGCPRTRLQRIKMPGYPGYPGIKFTAFNLEPKSAVGSKCRPLPP